jgi:hypothetical protein
MNRNAIALFLGLLVGPALTQGAIAQAAQPAITEAQARAIGVDAYLYFYPLISTDITRVTSTNIEAGKEPLKGPMNTFVSAAAYPPGDLKLVVRINFDTLYSLAWLDWPAPGSADTELGVLMEPEVCDGATEVYTGVQA